MTRPRGVRAQVGEGLLCGLADGIDALRAQGVPVHRMLLVGGGARSVAVQRIAPSVLGQPILVPPPGEYVAEGAARQAAWVMSGAAEPPDWVRAGLQEFDAPCVAAVREQYAAVRALSRGQ